jgi:hypothetical protein
MTKRALLIVALLLAWAPAVARADYDARKSEAMAELEKSSVTEEERAALKSALDTYFGGREDCFEGLIAIVAKRDESAQHATFTDRAGVCSVGANQVLSRALGNVKEPSKAALDYVNVLSGAESAFYESLRGVLVAEARDLIVVIRINLEDMTEVLDGKWKALLDEDATLDERAKQVTKEIEADLETVLREAADANPDLREVIAEGIKQWAENELSPTPTSGNTILDGMIELAKGALGPAIGMWQHTNDRARSRVDRYRTLFSSEERVLVMFEEVRDDVKEFLEKNDFPVAEAGYGKARSSMDAFVSSAKTSGQSRDAAELRDDLLTQLTSHLKDTADVYSKFIGRHKEKFFGALSPDIRRELVEHETWIQYATSLDGYGLDSKLRDWQTKATNYFDADLSRLSSDARERVKKGLRAIIDDYIKAMAATGDTHKEVRRVVGDERGAFEKKLD